MGTFGGHLWINAERQGRIRPGRGPYFTRRVYPSRAPRRRRDLLADGTPRRKVDSWERLASGIVLPPAPRGASSLPPGHRLGPGGWSAEDPGRLAWDILTRLRAHWLSTPDSVGAGWCAIAAHGMPYWADSEPVLLLSERRRRNRTGAGTATHRQLADGTRTVAIDPLFPSLEVVDAGTAVAQCVATIRAGKKTWWVPEVPGLDDREVRAIQFIDAAYQCTHLDTDSIRSRARNIVDRRTLDGLLGLCDLGAQSPMETITRLVLRDELPAGHSWTSQVTISLDNGTVRRQSAPGDNVTTPDLACTSLRVAVYYDGNHHSSEEQKLRDFRLYQRLKSLGWEAVRIDKELLRDRREMLEQVGYAIQVARRNAT
ncbi:MAG TPA: endonuclease domain-containing protein [Candidatus Corynebacterium avicola]|uniref:Endonuclease domain-containing protein n=1 Tax=Candidatus Corynebacterium avicola TaxID=2838527 RepID=A0A9D1RRX2_9CORY|nr:endonuclease domain-containing protein [Candidatus Corynebacterium avicola]